MGISTLSELKYRLAWNRRTSRQRYLILLCILLFVGLVLIVLITHLWKILKRPDKEICLSEICKHQEILNRSDKEICLSEICKHQADSIFKNMDFTVDPCQNFYEFVCGSYVKDKDIHNDETERIMKMYNHSLYLAKIQLEKSEVGDDHFFQNKVKKYYKSCLNKPTDIKEVVKEFLKATHLDGWPLTEDHHSRSTIEDVLALSYHNSDFLFNIRYRYYDLNIIKLSTGNVISYRDVLLNTREEKYIKLKKEYVDLIEYVFTKLLRSPNDAKRYVKEMIDFETSVAQIQGKSRIIYSSKTTIAELETECPQIKWKKIFKLYFKHIGFPEKYKDEFVVEKYENSMKELCNLVGNSNKRAIYNFLVWSIFFPYLDRFDLTFRQLLSDMENIIPRYKYNLMLFDDIYKGMWKYCILDMEGYIRLGLGYIILNSTTPEEEIEEMQMLAEDISNALEEIFSNEDWFDDYSKNVTKTMLKNIEYLIGYSNESLDVDCLNQIFENIIITENYIENIFFLKKKMHIDKTFNKNISRCYYKQNLFPPFHLSTIYSEDIEGVTTLVIPLGVMQYPLYIYGLPKYRNYGRMGNYIGTIISSRFARLDHIRWLPARRGLLSLQNIEDTEYEIYWPKGFMKEYKLRKNCLINQYSYFPLEGNRMVNGNKTVWANFADNSGLIATFRAYENYLKYHGEEPSLPGLDFTNRQMFFITFAQAGCKEVPKKFYEDDRYVPEKYKVLVPLMNSPEFSKAFNCPLKSYMNPEHKCKVWDNIVKE